MEFLFSKAAGVDGIFPNITTSYTSLITAPSKERIDRYQENSHRENYHPENSHLEYSHP